MCDAAHEAAHVSVCARVGAHAFNLRAFASAGVRACVRACIYALYDLPYWPV